LNRKGENIKINKASKRRTIMLILMINKLIFGKGTKALTPASKQRRRILEKNAAHLNSLLLVALSLSKLKDLREIVNANFILDI
jgi:hypothetical protein